MIEHICLHGECRCAGEKAESTERGSVLPLKFPTAPSSTSAPVVSPADGSSGARGPCPLCSCCIWALTRGRATRAMLMGTKWGVSPRWITEGEEKHVFSCIHMQSQAQLCCSSPFSLSPTDRRYRSSFFADFLSKHMFAAMRKDSTPANFFSLGCENAPQGLVLMLPGKQHPNFQV